MPLPDWFWQNDPDDLSRVKSSKVETDPLPLSQTDAQAIRDRRRAKAANFAQLYGSRNIGSLNAILGQGVPPGAISQIVPALGSPSLISIASQLSTAYNQMDSDVILSLTTKTKPGSKLKHTVLKNRDRKPSSIHDDILQVQLLINAQQTDQMTYADDDAEVTLAMLQVEEDLHAAT